MSFLVYQRSDPRYKKWLPLLSQQIRLRNLIQVLGLNLDIEDVEGEVYFTLHTRAMSTPFYTSEKVISNKRIATWNEIQPRQIPESIHLSAPGFILRLWSLRKDNSSVDPRFIQVPISSWAITLRGLHYLGSKGNWNTKDFGPNTILFRMPFGFFTCLDSLAQKLLAAHRYLQIQVPTDAIRSSYTLKQLSSLHSMQRSLLDEVSLARDIKSRITLYGFSDDVNPDPSRASSRILGEKSLNRLREGRQSLELKEKIEMVRHRVTILRDEKIRRQARVIQLKKDYYEAEDISTDLMHRVQILGREMDRLKEVKQFVLGKKQKLSEESAQLFRRKKELISELLLIYPLTLVEGSKKYSINEIQLPNAEDYGTETGGQISVALGYAAHLTAMISFFLGIPLRYPVHHFGSQSRIVDHITQAITDREREFPLYFRNKEDVYSRYGVYLLNKNIAQLRWYCGLSTNELRATLPNLHNLLYDRLIILGWPPSPSDSLELGQELTEEVDQQLLSSVSLDKGLDQLLPPERDIEHVRQVVKASWLRSSYSDLEGWGGGNNVVPSGEVIHGKTQDQFLNGWRKKTYESEEIDPRCLTNSLSLDFDAGRRLSNAGRPPTLLVSDEAKNVRRRRFGRVEHGSITFTRNTGIGNITKSNKNIETLSIPTSALTEPNANLSHIENEITKMERRRSLCGVGNSTPSPQPDGASTPVDVGSNCNLIPESTQFVLGEREQSQLSGVDEVEGRSDVTKALEFSTPGEFDQNVERQILKRYESQYDPSSDEGGDDMAVPSPPIPLVRCNSSPEILNSPTQELAAQIEPKQEVNPLNFQVDHEPTFETSYKIQIPFSHLQSDFDEGKNESIKEKPTAVLEDENDILDTHIDRMRVQASDTTDSDDGDDILGGGDCDDESLWLRAAALLNPSSFNVMKRRISDSNAGTN